MSNPEARVAELEKLLRAILKCRQINHVKHLVKEALQSCPGK